MLLYICPLILYILRQSLFSGYAEAIARHLLKKFLILVFFLDHAKSKRLVPQDPCLFCKDVEFKVRPFIGTTFSASGDIVFIQLLQKFVLANSAAF
jgi:abnormal spindle-like microcephaly-associated protein